MGPTIPDGVRREDVTMHTWTGGPWSPRGLRLVHHPTGLRVEAVVERGRPEWPVRQRLWAELGEKVRAHRAGPKCAGPEAS
jgi:hypothetical protein